MKRLNKKVLEEMLEHRKRELDEAKQDKTNNFVAKQLQSEIQEIQKELDADT